MKQLVLFLITFYQKFLSFDTGIFHYLFPNGRTCRFTPRCSTYTYEAIVAHGIIKGLKLGIVRISRCHPWNPGGVDPVPQT
ncbi:membrane protein insertion efficiency factor YidD [Candidatus Microgenomates bacterium]|nr:MAG: membrane protein insertion efficiency factor YidD [Candidatus Microgenomates bacterium]